MRIIWNDELYHYGVPRRSGRYKWGSGANPYHHGAGNSKRAIRKIYKKEKKTIRKQSDQLLKDNKREYRKDSNANRRESYKKGIADIRKSTGISQYEAKKAYRKAISTRIKDVKGVDTSAYKRAIAKYNKPTELIFNVRPTRLAASRFVPLGINTRTSELYNVTKRGNKYNIGYTSGATIGPLQVPTRHTQYVVNKKRKK